MAVYHSLVLCTTSTSKVPKGGGNFSGVPRQDLEQWADTFYSFEKWGKILFRLLKICFLELYGLRKGGNECFRF